MIEEFAKQLTQNYKLRKDHPFLLACSGGVDSVVLTHLFHRLGYSFALAYCNFKLRLPDCDKEAAFVQALGKQLDKPVHVKVFNTTDYMQSEKVSVQMAARALRYQWFDALLNAERYTTLVTAHHADDQIETLLLNIGRGNGPLGLTGLHAKTKTKIRPLLMFSKTEIQEYAISENLSWCEDSSNGKNDYLRNAIRNEVLPAWEKYHPHLRKNLTQSIRYLQQAQKVLKSEIEQFKHTNFKEINGVYHLPVAAIQGTADFSFYLHHIYFPFGFEHTKDLIQLLSAATGKQLFSKTHRLLKNRDTLLLSPLPMGTDNEVFWDGVKPLENPIHLYSTRQETTDTQLVLDKETLIFPLKLRKMKEGDYFYPVGMKGKKKLSKFFKDEKYSLLEKENQWLLCSEEKIVWVIGKRSDRRFLKTSETKQLFCIQTK